MGLTVGLGDASRITVDDTEATDTVLPSAVVIAFVKEGVAILETTLSDSDVEFETPASERLTTASKLTTQLRAVSNTLRVIVAFVMVTVKSLS